MKSLISTMLILMAASIAGAQAAPKVIKLEPAHLSAEVDSKTVKRLTVTFDQPMNTNGFSFCGGGPTFPKVVGKPKWLSTRVCVMDVQLEADHAYSLLLNCPSGGNFRSARGVKVPPTPWKFTTLPAKLLNPVQQRAINRASLIRLKSLLATRYSYYDLRGLNWDDLFADANQKIIDSKTPKGWAQAVSEMLKPTQDIHMSLRYKEDFFGVGSRAIDPLYRSNLLGQYIKDRQQIGNRALVGKTKEGFGYVLIAGWTSDLDLVGIDAALGRMRDVKGMIVDVRPNSGGGENLARHVAQWFVTGEKVYAKNRYRTGAGPDGFGPVLERKIKGNQLSTQKFRGPVVVLSSRYVMSSNEAFVLMMKQADDCTVVGQTTYGSSGNPKAHELTNGVTIVMPSWQAMEPNGNIFEGVGIKPDVEVLFDTKELERRDPILERGLEILKEKAGNP